MTSRRYLTLFSCITFLLLATVAGINFIVDPGDLYPDLFTKSTSTKSYVRALITSSRGLTWPQDSLDDRTIKMHMARLAKADGVILGSSHVMQIGQATRPTALTELCPTLVNLAVSGGSLEDLLALSGTVAQRPEAFSTIIFSVAPWTFHWNKDKRSMRYAIELQAMLESIQGEARSDGSPHLLALLKNTLNIHYFMRSITKLFQHKYGFSPSPKFNVEQGPTEPVLLPDGSLVYSADYTRKARQNNVPKGQCKYKLKPDGPAYDPNALKIFRSLVLHMKKLGFRVVLLMTPYHPNVWADPQCLAVRTMRRVETIVLQLGRELNVPVYGSFDPQTVGCASDEFYDCMHPTGQCMSKLEAAQL